MLTNLRMELFQALHKVELLVPTTPAIGRGKLTVGKIYGGLLILENWKQTKFGTVDKPFSTKVCLYLRVILY